jgi:hypothetical protein
MNRIAAAQHRRTRDEAPDSRSPSQYVSKSFHRPAHNTVSAQAYQQALRGHPQTSFQQVLQQSLTADGGLMLHETTEPMVLGLSTAGLSLSLARRLLSVDRNAATHSRDGRC